MASGAPVAAARAGAIPEVSGSAARYFDPTDVREIAEAIAELADRARAGPLVARGLQRAREFSWDATADRTLDLYRKLSPAAMGAVRERA
jgi:glycosyltransferase involved in cell wall biosynthesis